MNTIELFLQKGFNIFKLEKAFPIAIPLINDLTHMSGN